MGGRRDLGCVEVCCISINVVNDGLNVAVNIEVTRSSCKYRGQSMASDDSWINGIMAIVQ